MVLYSRNYKIAYKLMLILSESGYLYSFFLTFVKVLITNIFY